MDYLIYKISNKIDNKFYVGKHKTENKNDDYFGSGLLLKRAVEKYGKNNFVKELLFECSSEEEMNQKEADIIDEDFITRDDTYNIKLGGNGGFDYINKNGKNHGGNWKESMKERSKKGVSKFRWLLENDPSFREEFSTKSSNRIRLYQSINGNPFQGKHHSEETKKKMSEAKKGKINGKKNPSFGKHWITNGVENRLLRKDVINLLLKEDGWRKGRILM